MAHDMIIAVDEKGEFQLPDAVMARREVREIYLGIEV